MSKYEVTTLKKGLQILDLLRERTSLTLKEITVELDISKSGAFRLLATLEEMEYVQKIHKQYELNHKLFLPSYNHHSVLDWMALQSPYSFAKEVDASFYIGRLIDDSIVMTQVIHSPYTQPDFSEIGNRSQLHVTALGKVLLAHLPEHKKASILKDLSLTKSTKNSFNDLDLFYHHLEVIQSQGYAIDDEEHTIGERCIAVPLFIDGQIIAAIAIAGSVDNLRKAKLKSFIKHLQKGSKKMEHEISFLFAKKNF